MSDYYELLESPPVQAEAVARLWSWSENHSYPTPANVFMDLIGLSQDLMGEPFCTMTQAQEKLGYLEIGMLADALQEYADRPQDVLSYLNNLIPAEMEG